MKRRAGRYGPRSPLWLKHNQLALSSQTQPVYSDTHALLSAALKSGEGGGGRDTPYGSYCRFSPGLCPRPASRLFPSGKQPRIQDSSRSPTLAGKVPPRKAERAPGAAVTKRHLPRGGSSCLVSLPAGGAERARCQRRLLARPSLPPPRMRLVFSVRLCQHGPGGCWADLPVAFLAPAQRQPRLPRAPVKASNASAQAAGAPLPWRLRSRTCSREDSASDTPSAVPA